MYDTHNLRSTRLLLLIHDTYSLGVNIVLLDHICNVDMPKCYLAQVISQLELGIVITKGVMLLFLGCYI